MFLYFRDEYLFNYILMKLGVKLLLGVVLLSFTSKAVTYTVNQTASGSPWSPITVGSFAWAIDQAGAGDTIIFDYGTLGAAPTIVLDPAFANFGIGGFIIDGLRGKPANTGKVKFQGTSSQFNGLFLIQNANTVLIGLEFLPASGNGVFITSSNTTIDSCLIHGMNYHAVNIGNGTSNNVIKNSIIFDNNKTPLGATDDEHGAIVSAGQVTIDSCFLYDNHANGVLIRNSGATGSVISNSVFGRAPDGTESGNDWNGVFVWGASNVTTRNNIIVNNGVAPNGSPVRISGVRYQEMTSGTISDNYIGTDAVKTNAGNSFDGVTLHTNVSGVNLTGNVIAYNGFGASGNGGGLALRNNVSNINVSSNFIGAHRDSSDAGNKEYGISVESGTNITIGGAAITDGNVIGYSSLVNAGKGVWISFAGTSAEVYNNLIVGNEKAGVEIQAGADNSIIGAQNQGNIITQNGRGIIVNGSGTDNNTLRYNSFSCNTVQGIDLQSSGNDNYGNAPFSPASKSVIVNTAEKRANFVSGYVSSANATVDIYTPDAICPVSCESDASQGLTMITTVNSEATPSANGLYFWEYDFVTGGNLVGKNNVVVLATESGVAGQTNTSEFSVCANLCNTPENSAINSNDLDVCFGRSVDLVANSTGRANGEDYSYSWYLGSIDPNNLVSYAVNDSDLTVTTAGTYIAVIASQLDSVSCLDTSTQATVVINDLPNVDVTSAQSEFCAEDSVALSAGFSTGSYSFTWNPNIGTTNEVQAKQGGSYKVIVTDLTTNCIDSGTVSVTENSLPVPSVSAAPFCLGASTTIDAGVNGLQYAWSPSNETTQSFSVSDSGWHYLTLTDPVTNCEQTDSIYADMSPNDNPEVTIVKERDTICFALGEAVDLEASFVSAGAGELTWSSGQTGQTTINVADTGLFTATYTTTDKYGCSGSDEIRVVNYCAPPDPYGPNVVTTDSPWEPIDPTGTLTPDQFTKSDLTILNRWGRKIFSTTEILPKWEGKTEGGRDCSAGVYYFVWKYTNINGEEFVQNGFIHLVR